MSRHSLYAVGLGTCEKLENAFHQVFGDSACEAVAVELGWKELNLKQLEIVSGGFESKEFWQELYLIFRLLFFARASKDAFYWDRWHLDEGILFVELKGHLMNQQPWKQPWWRSSRYLDPAEVEDRRRLLGARFKYVLLNRPLSERARLLREHYRLGLIGFGDWAGGVGDWLHAFMILHHDLFPWTVHLLDARSDKIVRGWSSLQVRGTRFMGQVMSELEKDELSAYPVTTYEYIYDFELAEGMASNAARLDWGVTNSAAKRHRGARSLGPFDLRKCMMTLQQSL